MTSNMAVVLTRREPPCVYRGRAAPAAPLHAGRLSAVVSTFRRTGWRLSPRYGTLRTCSCLLSGELMASTLEVLEAEALQLSASERARLVELLIASLDIDPDVEEAWAAEVERRNAEIESGAVSLVPGPEALASLRAQFR